MKDAPALLAEVAVSLPVEGSFQYTIPASIHSALKPGHRVLVPFGRRTVTGYVVDILDSSARSSRDFVLKDIIRQLDSQPLFGAELMSLFRFVAEYYHYPLGMVISEALPTGLNVSSQRTAVLTDTGRQVLLDGLPASNENVLLRRLASKKSLPASAFAKDKASSAMLRKLETRGWLTYETRLKKDKVGPRIERWLAPVEASPGDPDVRLGPREKELVERLNSRGATPVADLRSSFPSLPQIVTRLEKKGFITIEEREVYRDFLGQALVFDPEPKVLAPEQVQAVKSISKALAKKAYKTFLLHGVTGSGKTEVYLNAAAEVLKMNRTALFLVPEISLTPAMEGIMRARLNEDVAVFHSGLSHGERYDQWLRIMRREVNLVLGARSALFAPLANLGLIVVDEEHDQAYKQGDKLRYHGRDLAVARASQVGAVVILGSATPSLESYTHANSGRYKLLKLTSRVGGGRLPRVEILDMRIGSRRVKDGLTPALRKAITETLERGEQSLLFLNRRGLAPYPMCLSCGFVIKCVNCSVSLTLHKGVNNSEGANRLVCHYCGYEIPQPKHCPDCRSKAFSFIGMGTEKLQDIIQREYPEARVGRLDADTAKRKGSSARILQRLRTGELDILVGTQMITKGHDFPNITLVGVIEADLGLHLPDFRAGERTFQLLAQVAGRAGRGTHPGQVLIQTLNPQHYSLKRAQHHDFTGFYEDEISHRRQAAYPPYSRMAMVRFQGRSEPQVRKMAYAAVDMARRMISNGGSKIEIIGPAPSPLSKVKGRYRFQCLLRAARATSLTAFIQHWTVQAREEIKTTGVMMFVDMDPYHVM